MNRNLLFSYLLFLFLSVFNLNSQSYDWQWAKSAVGPGTESGTSVSTDPLGNVLVGGYFAGSYIVVGADTLKNKGGLDGFIIKYDALGNVLWSKVVGGSAHDRATGVTTDASGNIYVIGSFGSSTIYAGNFSVTNAGLLDLFILKYDPSGNVVWFKSFGNAGIDVGSSICKTASGDLAFTGYFSSDTLNIGIDTLVNSGGEDVLICQMTAGGIIQWSTSLTGNMNERGAGITSDIYGDVYVTGDFFSTELSGSGDTVLNTGSNDIFTCKFDVLGNVIWLKNLGGDWNDFGSSVCVSPAGDIVIIATYNSTLVSVGTATVGSKGGFDILMASYSAAGSILWIKSEGDIFDEKGYGVSYDVSGNLFFTGHTHSPSLIIGDDTLYCNGVGDIFVGGYDQSGNHLMTTHIGGGADDGTSALTCDVSGNVLTTGYYMSSVLSCPVFTLSNTGSSDLFVGKVKHDGLITTSTKEIADINDVMLYPNPARGEFFISSLTLVSDIIIFSMTGETLYHFESSLSHIDIEGLSSGLYLVKVSTPEREYLKKLVVH